ncbi:MAG: leucine-rich repeat domain-containing protein [Lachnospiraceae bacterium]|nr:leucine-rich repeat domain-containing protein [Lachnospiraceae bacterium]
MGKGKSFKRVIAFLLSLAMVLTLGDFGLMRPVTAKADGEKELRMSTWVNWWTEPQWDDERQEDVWHFREEPQVAEGMEGDENHQSYYGYNTILCWGEKKVAFSIFDGEGRHSLSENAVLSLYQANDDFEIVRPADTGEGERDTKLVVPPEEFGLVEDYDGSESDTYGTCYIAEPGNYVIASDDMAVKVEAVEPIAGFTTAFNSFSRESYVPNYRDHAISKENPVYFLYKTELVDGIEKDRNGKAKITYYVWNDDEEVEYYNSPNGIKVEELTDGLPEGYGGYKFYIDGAEIERFDEKLRFNLDFADGVNPDELPAQERDYEIRLQYEPDQYFGLVWAQFDWEGEDSKGDLFYNREDRFETNTGMHIWQGFTIGLSLIDNIAEEKTAYKGALALTKAEWKDGKWSDTGVSADGCADFTLVGTEDEDGRETLEGFEDTAFYDVVFHELGCYCLTAKDAKKGNTKIYFDAHSSAAEFFSGPEFSEEYFIPDYELADLSPDDSLYFIMNKKWGDENFSFIGFARYSEELDEDVVFKMTDSDADKKIKEAYPYLKYEILKDDKDQVVIKLNGNGNNAWEQYDDVKFAIKESHWDNPDIRRLDVVYLISGLGIRRDGDEGGPSKEMETWAWEGYENFRLYKRQEEFTGVVDIEYKGETKPYFVENGNCSVCLDQVGDCIIKERNSNDKGVIVHVVPRAIDFYAAKDLNTRLFDWQYAAPGQDIKVYVYVNSMNTAYVLTYNAADVDDPGYDPDKVNDEYEERPFKFGDIQASGKIDTDDGEKYVDLKIPTPEVTKVDTDGMNGEWRVYTFPGVYNDEGTDCTFTSLDFRLRADVEGDKAGDRHEWKDLHYDIVTNTRYMLQIMEASSYDYRPGQYMNYLNMDLYPFGATAKFKPICIESEGTALYEDLIKDFDPKRLSIGHYEGDKFITDGVSVSYDADKQLVTATFIQEGEFAVRYQVNDNDIVDIGWFNTHLPDVDFYETEKRPDWYEDVHMFVDPVNVYEKKGVENSTFYLLWRTWDAQRQEEVEEVTRSHEKMSPDYAKLLLEYNTFDYDVENKRTPGDFAREYLTCIDPSTFKYEIRTEDDELIDQDDLAKYVTITDVEKDGYILGKKIVVSDQVKENILIVTYAGFFGAKVFDDYVVFNDQGYVEWDEERDCPYYTDYAVSHLNDRAMQLLKDHCWTANDTRELTYRADYYPINALRVDKAPAKDTYTAGDTLDLTGLAVSGIYANDTSYALSKADYTVNLTGALKTSDKEVVIAFKDNPSVKCKFNITVKEVAAPTPAPGSGDQNQTDQGQGQKQEDKPAPKVGESYTAADGSTYSITAVAADGTVKVEYKPSAAAKKAKTVKIDATVTINGQTYPVTAIAANAFKGDTKLKTVVFPNTITEIGANAFSGCKNLTKADLSKTKVEKIGKNAFANTKITKATLPDTCKVIGVGAFLNCSKLKTVVFGKGLTKVEKNALKKCGKLGSIQFKGTKVPKASAMKGLKNLSKKVKVKVPKSKKAAWQKLMKQLGYKGTVKS